MMIPERIAELRALCKAATPGPWSVERRDEDDGDIDYELYGSPYVWLFRIYGDERDGQNKHDAELISAARTALPELLDEVDELQGSLEDAQRIARDWFEEQQKARKDAQEAEAKLVKAVEALREIARPPNNKAGLLSARSRQLTARDALREIEEEPGA